MDFEWDAAKDRSNQSKHAISFAEALAVFVDSKLIVLDATRSEDNEDRLKAIGMIEEELIVVIFTMRESVTRILRAPGEPEGRTNLWLS